MIAGSCAVGTYLHTGLTDIVSIQWLTVSHAEIVGIVSIGIIRTQLYARPCEVISIKALRALRKASSCCTIDPHIEISLAKLRAVVIGSCIDSKIRLRTLVHTEIGLIVGERAIAACLPAEIELYCQEIHHWLFGTLQYASSCSWIRHCRLSAVNR